MVAGQGLFRKLVSLGFPGESRLVESGSGDVPMIQVMFLLCSIFPQLSSVK